MDLESLYCSEVSLENRRIAVMEVYGFWGKLNTESECVAQLMKMYQKLVDNIEKRSNQREEITMAKIACALSVVNCIVNIIILIVILNK